LPAFVCFFLLVRAMPSVFAQPIAAEKNLRAGEGRSCAPGAFGRGLVPRISCKTAPRPVARMHRVCRPERGRSEVTVY